MSHDRGSHLSQANELGQFTNNASGVTATFTSAIPSGFGVGVTKATEAILAAMGISQEQLSKRNSLIAILAEIQKDREIPKDFPGLNLFPELKDYLQGTAKAVASGASAATVAPTVTLSHVSQLPLNSLFASTAVTKATKKTDDSVNKKALFLSEEEIQRNENHFSANCKNLAEMFNRISRDIDVDIQKTELGKAHARSANSTGVLVATAPVATSVSVTASLDLIGSVFRESSALKIFLANESAKGKRDVEANQNIYKALNECSNVFSNSNNPQASLHALKNLRDAISNFKDANRMRNVHSALSPTISVFLRSITSAPFVTALESVVVSGEALHVSHSALTEQKAELSQSVQQSLTKASSIKTDGLDGANTHSRNVTDLYHAFQKVLGQIDNDLAAVAKNQQRSVSVTAKASVVTLSVLALVPELLTAFVGLISREVSGTGDATFQGDEHVAPHLRKISESNLGNLPGDIDKLLSQISNLNVRLARCKELGVTAPVPLAISEIATCATLFPTVSALQSTLVALEASRVSTQVLAENKDALKENSKQSAAQASNLQVGEVVINTHSWNVTTITNRFNQLAQQIGEKLKKDMGDDRHHKLAEGSAVASIGTLSLTATLTNLVTAATGLLLREAKGSRDFTKNDAGTVDEFKQVSKSEEQSGVDLDNLMDAVSQMKARLERSEQLGVSAHSTLGTSHVGVFGSTITALNSLMGMIFAIREFRSVSDPKQLSANLELNEQEKADVFEYQMSFAESHENTANFSKTKSASDQVTLHAHLQTIMEKAILTQRLSNDPLHEVHDGRINRTGHSLINGLYENSTGFLFGVLGVLASTAVESGITLEVFWRLFRLATEKCDALNKGPDELKTGKSHFNLSMPSNATRFTAAESDSSATKVVSQATHHVSEAALSRSLTIALCQSGALKQALSELSQEENAKQTPQNFLPSSGMLGRIRCEQLAAKIKEVLNRAGNDIPGLNKDMANQLASATAASIATALSTHSALIAPFLHSSVAVKEALIAINAQQTNEGLSDTFIMREITIASNIIHAFTQNCIALLKVDAEQASQEWKDDVEFNGSMQSHIDTNNTTAATMVATCYVSLLCDEILESMVSRSLALLDAEKMKLSSERSTRAASNEVKESVKESKEDSQLGESASATRILSALRLTLSHLGQSLAGMASELEKSASDDLQKDNMQMHSTQRTMLKALSAALLNCGSRMTETAGVLSMSPLTSLGTIDEMRHSLRSLYSVKSNHSGWAEETRQGQDCRSSASLGSSVDSTVGTVVLFVKALLSGLVMGSDSALSVAKILEIMSLHQRPEQALTLLTQAPLQPQGGLTGVTKLANSHMTAATVATAAGSNTALENVNSSDSTESTQDSIREQIIDRAIESCGFLDDEEEEKESADANETKLGLKKFYQIVVSVLAEENKLAGNIDNNTERLVGMFDRGGIVLAGYHSSLSNKNKKDVLIPNPLIQNGTFLGCNDATVLLVKLIQDITKGPKKPEYLIEQLQIKLTAENKFFSKKVHALWNTLIKTISDELVAKTKSANVHTPGFLVKKKFNAKEFAQACVLQEPAVGHGYRPTIRLSVNAAS